MTVQKKILIVDDEKGILEELGDFFSEHGYKVVLASDGDEGFYKLQQEKPDLVITDVLMPKNTGFQLVEKVRGLEQPESRTPFIVISGKGSMRDHFTDFSSTEFIQKVFDPEELLSRVQSIVGTSGAGVARCPEISGPRTRKKILIAGCKEFVMRKIEEHYAAAGHEAVLVSHEDEAVERALLDFPDAILCQYWKDTEVFDAVKIYSRLRRKFAAARLRFYVFAEDIGSVIIEAKKYFPHSSIISYKESPDLIRKLDEVFSI